jgi:hypothetical protein
LLVVGCFVLFCFVFFFVLFCFVLFCFVLFCFVLFCFVCFFFFSFTFQHSFQILRFNLVKDLTIAGKSALPSSSDSKLHQLIGVEGILMCIHNGVLHSDQGKFGNKVGCVS